MVRRPFRWARPSPSWLMMARISTPPPLINWSPNQMLNRLRRSLNPHLPRNQSPSRNPQSPAPLPPRAHRPHPPKRLPSHRGPRSLPPLLRSVSPSKRVFLSARSRDRDLTAGSSNLTWPPIQRALQARLDLLPPPLSVTYRYPTCVARLLRGWRRASVKCHTTTSHPRSRWTEWTISELCSTRLPRTNRRLPRVACRPQQSSASTTSLSKVLHLLARMSQRSMRDGTVNTSGSWVYLSVLHISVIRNPNCTPLIDCSFVLTIYVIDTTLSTSQLLWQRLLDWSHPSSQTLVAGAWALFPPKSKR